MRIARFAACLLLAGCTTQESACRASGGRWVVVGKRWDDNVTLVLVGDVQIWFGDSVDVYGCHGGVPLT